MAARRRLDVEMVRRGLVATRAKATSIIEEGHVLVSGAIADKPSRLVAPGEPVSITEPARYVSRGGVKLEGALERFAVDVSGLRCLDAGASTGGFTDCLLRRGAASVVSVDVGRGQLDGALRRDPRVTVLEGVNVRDLTADDVGEPPRVVVADLSFISLVTVADALGRVGDPAADFVVLVKPQFEAGKGRVGRGGVIRDAELHRDVVGDVVERLGAKGLAVVGVMASPIRGAAGNIEFLLHLRRDATPSVDSDAIAREVSAAHQAAER